MRYLMISGGIWIMVYSAFSLLMGTYARWKTYRGIDFTGLQILGAMGGDDDKHDYTCCLEPLWERLFVKRKTSEEINMLSEVANSKKKGDVDGNEKTDLMDSYSEPEANNHARVTSNSSNGAIIVMHDLGPSTHSLDPSDCGVDDEKEMKLQEIDDTPSPPPKEGGNSHFVYF